LENVEKELSGVRDRAHANSQTLTQIGFQVGEIRALADQVPSLAERMADKARRLASAEAVIKSNSDALADHSNRLHDLERNRQ
jgi:predicted  nucleic acid-binding Zn-ribbon protein